MSTDDAKQDTSEIENELVKELVEYMHTTVLYTVKRLLPADLKILYVSRGLNTENIESNPFQTDFQCVPHEVKGGVRLTKYITYNW